MYQNLWDTFKAVSRGKFIEINAQMRSKKKLKINKLRSWFFEKMNKIDRPLARLIKKKKKREESNRYNKK